MRKVITEIKASMGIYETRAGESYGLLAEFSNPGTLLHAAGRLREAGYAHFDTHSPFPIHGMDRAMGLGQSRVGYFALGGGIAGLLAGYLMQWWMGAADYPINVSGKPFFAIESAVPIIFELTILVAAIGAVAGMFAINGLPRPYNPLFYSDRFRRVTDDGFFLHVASTDASFDSPATERLLRDLGALHIETITDHETADA